jgi:hypothetical protein
MSQIHFETLKKGEQKYCRKRSLEKTPKVVLCHFAEFFSKKSTVSTKCQNFFLAINNNNKLYLYVIYDQND